VSLLGELRGVDQEHRVAGIGGNCQAICRTFFEFFPGNFWSFPTVSC
jgi:hypothetical protein